MNRLALLLTLALLSAATAQTLTLKHDEGTTTVKQNPQRVVVMDEEALGWMFALNLGDRVVGLGSSYLSPTDITRSKLKPEILEHLSQ
ncbi:hypothetical protein GCM10022631_25510 [Deinococcus rubellus]|uniref:hypothetical protein n=1 Tax=Deinococcus rubellus TaxID=1889240 RepID=UPI0031E87608